MDKKDVERKWDEALHHLQSVEEAYSLVTRLPRVNTSFALSIISEHRRRFDAGERTEELYENIMDLK